MGNRKGTHEVLEGISLPTAGTVRMLGHDPYRARRLVRPQMGIMLQEGGFPSDLTVAETGRMCASLIVTSHGRPGHLKRALAAGARGFLPKTVSAHVLADVVRTVNGGGRYVDPTLATVEEIARRASLSTGTVRNYLSSGATKLGAANRHEAVHVACTHGWI